MTMPTERERLHILLRHHLLSFVHRTFQILEPGKCFIRSWYIHALCQKLERVRRGDCKRLIVCLPPRSLKSLTVSVAFPAFVLGHDPGKRLICASYSGDLSTKFGRDTRTVMQHQAYRELFPGTSLSRRKNTETEFETSRGGFRLATSVGGTLTGRGGDILIVDDPLNARDAVSQAARDTVHDWFTGTLLSRLDDKTDGAIIVVMQRLHTDDLAGLLLKQDAGWETLILPAIATERTTYDLGYGHTYTRQKGEALSPDREPLETLALLRKQLGSYVFSAQYQQDPLPLTGGLIKWNWFGIYDEPMHRDLGIVVQSWDTANKGTDLSDYSVCLTFVQKDGRHDLIDVFREKLDYPALKQHMIRLAERYHADAILVEEAGSGIQLLQEMRGTLPVHGITPVGDKLNRMYVQTVKLENGLVRLPKDAPWLEEFKRELLTFPESSYKDQVDAFSQYLGWQRPYEFNADDIQISYLETFKQLQEEFPAPVRAPWDF